MNIEETIRQKISEHLNPKEFKVINQSHLHAGHAGDDGSGQTHFKVVVVSSKFNGMQMVLRHRMVNELLSDCFNNGLHALSLDLKPED